jgi:hypothetical protein
MAAMWLLSLERIMGFQPISVLMAFATSGALSAAAIGGQRRLEWPRWRLTCTAVDGQSSWHG